MCDYIKQILKLPGSVKYFILTDMIMKFGMGIWNINLNFFLASKGMSMSEIGRVVSVGSLSTAVFAVVCGLLCDKNGYKKSMLTGCGLKALAMLWTAFAKPGILLYSARSLNGLGDCFILVCAYPYITSMVRMENKNTVYSLLFATSMFSMFLGNVFAGLCLSSEGWNNGFVVIIISACIVAAVAVLRSFLPETTAKKSNNLKLYLPRKSYIKAYLIFDFIGYAGYFLAYSMMNIIYKEMIGLSIWSTSVVIGFSTVAASLAVFMAPPIRKKYGGVRVSTNILLALVVLYFVMMISKGLIFIILTIFTTLLQNMMVGLVEGPMLSKIPDNEKGGYTGLWLLITQTGATIGAYEAGSILNSTVGYFRIYMVVCAMATVQTLIYFFGFKNEIEHEEKSQTKLIKEELI